MNSCWEIASFINSFARKTKPKKKTSTTDNNIKTLNIWCCYWQWVFESFPTCIKIYINNPISVTCILLSEHIKHNKEKLNINTIPGWFTCKLMIVPFTSAAVYCSAVFFSGFVINSFNCSVFLWLHGNLFLRHSLVFHGLPQIHFSVLARSPFAISVLNVGHVGHFPRTCLYRCQLPIVLYNVFNFYSQCLEWFISRSYVARGLFFDFIYTTWF